MREKAKQYTTREYGDDGMTTKIHYVTVSTDGTITGLPPSINDMEEKDRHIETDVGFDLFIEYIQEAARNEVRREIKRALRIS